MGKKIKHIDLSMILSASACLFVLFGTLASRPNQIISCSEPERETEQSPCERIFPLPDVPRAKGEVEYNAELEETPEFSAVMYATQPIGRYYITAYNHLETGSKITASGTKCHEGTITTAAADVWGGYFRFGDYVEITVNGEPRLYKIEDTGSAVKKRHIDIYFASYKQMSRYNSNYQTISRVTFPFGKPKEG